MSDINDLLGLAIDKNPVDFADTFNQLIQQKAVNAVEAKRIELAQSIYGGTDQSADADDDLDLDDVGDDEFDYSDDDLDDDELDLDDVDLDALDLDDIDLDLDDLEDLDLEDFADDEDA